MPHAPTILRWNQQDLAQQLLTELDHHRSKLGRWINGRIVGLLASPTTSTSSHFAIGVSAVPAGTSTPEHSHAAEELAIVMSGTGIIFIDDDKVMVAAGDVVLTPPESIHRTAADPGSALTVLWIYSKSDSALRWLEENPVEG